MAETVIYPGDNIKAVKKAKKLAVRSLTRLKMFKAAKAINPKSSLYGPAAVVGIKALQKHYGLKNDGIIGPNTWTMLNKTGSIVKPKHRIRKKSSWNPAPPKKKPVHVKWDKTTIIWLHHTVTKPPTNGGTAGEEAAMRELQRIAFSRDFSDISYSYLVFPSGHIYEGRGHEILGAHTLGHNEDIGVALVGNYDTSKPTDAQIEAVKWLKGKLNANSIHPHKEVYATACPGKYAIAAFGL